MTDLTLPIQQVQSALIHDPDYRLGWVANVACAVMDETGDAVDWETRQKIGERFVQYLCAGHPDSSSDGLRWMPLTQVDLDAIDLNITGPLYIGVDAAETEFSNTGCTVYVDGVIVGPTQQALDDLAPLDGETP